MSDPTRILVIDDEESICFAFERFFAARGGEVIAAATGARGLELFREHRPAAVFLDVRLPDRGGLEVLGDLLAEDPDACVIVITAYGSMDVVREAIGRGAFDYLVKPIDLDRAGELVGQVVASRSLGPGESPAPESDGAAMIGNSRVMQEVYKQAIRAARTTATVLIRGETGTGKEMLARTIHNDSGRAGTFVAINCGALPEALVESELFGYARGAFTGADADKPGRFEQAAGGTLFLDEIAELPPPAQVKLLRFLDSHQVERLGSVAPVRVEDVRIVAATNRDLTAEIPDRFREDLYFRLAEVQITLPPLRERREDIAALAEHFADGVPISPAALQQLEQRNWPGNVRELRNAVRQAAVASGGRAILPAHLPLARAMPAGDDVDLALARFLDALDAPDGAAHPTAVARVEAEVIRRALSRTGGNQTAAAELLGLHRNTLRAKLRELHIDAPPEQ